MVGSLSSISAARARNPTGVRLVFQLANDALELCDAFLETIFLVLGIIARALSAGVVYFVDTEAGQTELGASAAWTFAVAHSLRCMAVQT